MSNANPQALKIASKGVGLTGYGLMGLTTSEKPFEDSIKVMKLALESGSNFWNGGIFYGSPTRNSLHLLQAYFEKYPEDAERVVLSMKGSFQIPAMIADGTPEGVRKEVELCNSFLRNAGKKLDVYECARVDPNVPIETTIGALAELVKEGQIGGIGLSEVNGDTVRRAAKIHQIASVEIEFGLWASDTLEKTGVGKACAELGIPVVAYSPLGRGILGGTIRKFEDIPEGDYRRYDPRYQPDTLAKNIALVDAVAELAKRKNVTSSQIGLAWVKAFNDPSLYPGHDLAIIPIPGTSSENRVKENTANVSLTKEEFDELNAILAEHKVHGERYAGPLAKFSDQ